MIFLVLAGIASGLLTAVVFRLTTNTAALRGTLRQIQAHFFEFRLFFDEPRLIWRAQKDLLRANLRALSIVSPSILILSLPMTWVILQLEKAPLKIGEPTVVTVQLAHPADEVTLEAPPGIVIDMPPVHITADHQIAWRIRLLKPIAGRPQLTARPPQNVVWLKVDYPAASRWHVVWFFIISTITSIATLKWGAAYFTTKTT